jgi:tetratricopeptide (TPR) repeat protein
MKCKLLSTALLLTLFFAASNTQAQTAEQTAFSKGYELEYAGKYEEAIAQLKAVYNEKEYSHNIRLGYLYYEAKNYTESEKYYAKATALMPFAVEAKLGYVLPLASLGNWTKVKTVYEEILKIDPQNSIANYRIGTMYYYSKDYAKAATYLEKVVNLYPFSYDGLLMMAWTDLKLAKYNDAKILFNRVLLLSPSDSSAMEGLKLIK